MLQLLQVEAQRMMEVEVGRPRWLGGQMGPSRQIPHRAALPWQGQKELSRSVAGGAQLSFLTSRIIAPACQALGRG